jgi:hypothetical protein
MAFPLWNSLHGGDSIDTGSFSTILTKISLKFKGVERPIELRHEEGKNDRGKRNNQHNMKV